MPDVSMASGPVIFTLSFLSTPKLTAAEAVETSVSLSQDYTNVDDLPLPDSSTFKPFTLKHCVNSLITYFTGRQPPERSFGRTRTSSSANKKTRRSEMCTVKSLPSFDDATRQTVVKYKIFSPFA